MALVAGALGLVLAAAIVVHPATRDAAVWAVGWVRAAGPVPFFAAMALLPLPLAWFTIPAGEAFAAELTLPGVIAAALGAIAVQITLCYAVARSLARPLVHRWVLARGYAVPQVTRGNALALVLLVRLIPGPPLPLQCFLLGLAGVPFGTYLLASWLLTVPWVIGGVVLGRGVLSGSITLIAAGVGCVGAAAIAVHLARRRWTAESMR